MTSFVRDAIMGGRSLSDGNDDENVTRKKYLNLFHLCYFAIISTRSTYTKIGELSRNQIGRSGVQVKNENEKFAVVLTRSPQNLKCGHFRWLFCRGQQKNVSKCKAHMQSDCFCSLNLLFCGVVVAVAVVVASVP